MNPRLQLMRRYLAGDATALEGLPVTFPPTLNRLLGIALTEIDAERCCMTLKTDPAQHANPLGTIHGGILCDLGDAAIGVAHSVAIGLEESFTSVELRISFLRPVWMDVLTATAVPVHRGRTLSLYECDIVNAEGKLVARLSSTVMTLRGDAAQGR